jgi:hypothetical protein
MRLIALAILFTVLKTAVHIWFARSAAAWRGWRAKDARVEGDVLANLLCARVGGKQSCDSGKQTLAVATLRVNVGGMCAATLLCWRVRRMLVAFLRAICYVSPAIFCRSTDEKIAAGAVAVLILGSHISALWCDVSARVSSLCGGAYNIHRAALSLFCSRVLFSCLNAA